MAEKERYSPKKNITSRDVAKLAGVSQSTVSRAYSSSYKLDPVLKNKVFEAAKTLGYSPNALARGLLSNKSNIIAIISSTLNNPFYSSALQLFVSRLQQHGLQSLVFVPENSEDIDTVIDKVLSYRVDLVLIFGAKITSTATRFFSENNIPTVLFNRNIPLSHASAVCCNDYMSGYLVAHTLYSSGCRHFAYISGHEDVSTNIDRQRGFIDGLAAEGISDCCIIQGGYEYGAGLVAGEEMMRVCPGVDACFCINDITAIGVLDYIKYNTSKRVPEDISIVGFDDIPIASHVGNSLSTIRQPLSLMVDSTIETVLELLENPNRPPVVKNINGEFVARKTTK